MEAISRVELFTFLTVLLLASNSFRTDLFIDASSSSLFIFVVDLRESGLLFFGGLMDMSEFQGCKNY